MMRVEPGDYKQRDTREDIPDVIVDFNFINFGLSNIIYNITFT